MSRKHVLFAAGAAIVAAGAFVVWKIGGPGMVLGMLRYDERREGTLRPGDPAPDVTLETLSGDAVRLATYFGRRPLVLVFGSYT